MTDIQGTVEDSDGNAIENATVTIRDSATKTTVAETTTDELGNFFIDVDPDTYDILIEKISYQPYTETEVTVMTDESYTTSVTLQLLPPKVIGSRSETVGIGVLGETTAGSGSPIALKGEVASDDGYGLYTPDDVRVDGVAELDNVTVDGVAELDNVTVDGVATLASLTGSLTGGNQVSDLTGDNLSVENGSLTTDSPIVQTTTPTVAAAGTEWKRLDDRGTEIWRYTTGGSTRGVQSVFQRNGVVYAATDDNSAVIALDAADGSFNWDHTHHSTAVKSVHERDGVVYSGAEDDTVVAASAADGSFNWEHTHHSNWVNGVFARDGTVYSASADDTVVAADAADGSFNWEHTHHSSNVLALHERSGTVYSAGLGDLVVAANASDGTFVWDHSHHGGSGGAETVFERDGVVYSGGRDDRVVAADASDGSIVWDNNYGEGTVYSVFERNGRLYIGTNSLVVIVADAADGTELWRHSLHGGTGDVRSVFERKGVLYSGDSGDDEVIASVSDPTTYVSNGDEWLFQLRLVSDREGGPFG